MHLFRLLFVIIFAIGIYLRFLGSSPGYPPYHSDEGISYSSAVSMIKNKNLDPLRYDYPSVVPLTNYIFFENFFVPVSWGTYYARNMGSLVDGLIKIPLSPLEYNRVFQLEVLGEREIYALWWGRVTTAILGIGSVLLTYLLSKKLFNKWVGLMAAAFVAVNYRHVLNSHFGLPDIYNNFYLLLSALLTHNVWKNPTMKNYLIAGLFAGVSMAVKYQFFAFFPILLVHLLLWRKGEKLISPKIILVPIIGIVMFVFLNPYMFLHIEQTHEWLSSVSGKYRTGRMMLDVYPLSYLYHIAIGKVGSIVILVSTLFMIIKRPSFAGWFLLSIVIPFFYITIFATGGGFYTRNFVTIIPFLLIIAAAGLYYIYQQVPNKIMIGIVVLFAGAIIVENFQNSIVVAREYARPWNFQVLSSWITKNIEEGSAISAHSSVPLPVKDVTRLPYDFHLSFSVDEFAEDNADYAIANTDWATGDFYWWMTVDTRKGIEYWQKPVHLMQNQYAALSLQEMAQFSVYSVVNHWQAPDSNFIVADIPQFNVEKEADVKDIKPQSINGRWFSNPIRIDNWDGFVVSSKIKTTSNVSRDGYVFVVLYSNELDAANDTNRKYVRLSKRNKSTDAFEQLDLVGEIPQEVTFARIGVGVYNPEAANIEIQSMQLTKAKVKMITKKRIMPLKLEPEVLYPSSHGYL